MKIELRKIKIVNFKGLRDFTADFDGNGEVRGDNATGKTTLFDAFTWCLYGKDSYGRSDTNFQVKPLDENGKVIEKLPHEVELLLDINGTMVNIRREYKEMWTKKRGSKEEVFTGHTTERYWNDVPCTEREFKTKIDTICSEDVFKLITNPTYFLSMPKKEQRQLLLSMADDVTRESLPEFAQLVARMSGKTTEEYTKEIAAKIKRIKADMEGIPERIDERKRDMPEEADWSALRDTLKSKQAESDNLWRQIESKTEAFEQYNQERQKLFRELSDTRVKISQRRHELREQALADYYKSAEDARAYEQSVAALRSTIQAAKQDLEKATKELEGYTATRERLIAEWRTLKTRRWEGVDDSQFICPTCKQPLPHDDVEAKIAEMERNYNAETAKMLEANKQAGLTNNTKKAACESLIESIEESITKNGEKLAELERKPIIAIAKPQVDTEFNDDPTIKELHSLESGIELSIEGMEIYNGADKERLEAQRNELWAEINKIQLKLQDEQRIEANNKRIAELEKQYKTQQAEIASLEGEINLIDEMKHALIDKVESQINSKFSIVKFKMYETQINGGEKETCEALVDGVPYSTNLNTAARINAGIDIINAISKHNDVYAPIFIDNRESITSLIDTEAQVINLIKDENYKFLTTI